MALDGQSNDAGARPPLKGVPAQASTPPAITLPKGGGAIRGIGEKFAANPVTGSGSMSVPIATSPGRSGFGPQLSLSYDSGGGSGPFGFGWSLSLPSISRKTDKGLPKYFDVIESDVFILSGAEDCVPVYRQDHDGTWIAQHPGFQRDADGFWVRDPLGRLVVHEDELDGHIVRRYRPRVEGLFARIERWTRIDSPGDVHWRSLSSDNILTLYGRDGNSRIADPLDPARIFSWLICESRDDKGNGIRYLYKPEDGACQLRPGQPDPFTLVHQRNRGSATDPRRAAQRYLQRVLYGNLRPLLDAQGQRPRQLSDLPLPPTDTSADWLFEVRFDYGELDENDPAGQPEKSWFYRPDAFSSYRAGFEVRTCRRCERVLMLHHIPDQPAAADGEHRQGYRGVVRSTAFTYDDELNPGLATRPVYSFLKQVVQTGWKQEGGAITRRSLPPLEFEYSGANVQESVENVDSASLQNLPVGLDGNVYRWTDLHGEGIPGILTEQAGSWYYKRNLSPLPQGLADGSHGPQARFAPLEAVASKPNVALSAGAELMDLAGDGQPDVVVTGGPAPGLYEHDEAEGWEPFLPFTARLNREFRDPNLKWIDLDGDGHADILISEQDAFVWHRSLSEQGFESACRVAQVLDEEKGPRLVFSDGTQSIFLADMSGDGLTDLVRIRNEEVCYWPNLGYCRFGAKVTMSFEDEDGRPGRFDDCDQFDHQRLRLADIDGSGTTDIIYLHQDGVRLYFNQCGNSWSQPKLLKSFPPIDDEVSITPLDLLGNGTACLVWSSPSLNEVARPMRYVNLMGGRKPHLLVKVTNNLGAETRIHYAPSTRFYLQDKRDGTPWITRLPFPVHVIDRVETYDHVSGNRLVSRYAYHDGHFDGEEREFCGFGRVDQWDTEEIGAVARGAAPDSSSNLDEASYVPPVLTRTWFHTGIHRKRKQVSRHYEGEYYREPGVAGLALEDTLLPDGLSAEEEREACRALKGLMLRQEVYAEDAFPGASPDRIERAKRPYTITEQNFTIVPVQPIGGNRHAVFFTHSREAISCHCERNPVDPRIQHALTLEVDAFGNVLKQVAIGYGRGASPLPTDWDRKRQTTTLVTLAEHRFTQDHATGRAAIERDDHYRLPLPCESRMYQLTGIDDGARRLDFSEVLAGIATATPLEYEGNPTVGQKQKRLIEHARTRYRSDDFEELLPLGDLEPLALSGESYKLALTPGLLDGVFGDRVTEAMLSDEGGYVHSENDDKWWIPSGRIFLSPVPGHDPAQERAYALRHFYLPHRYRNSFGKTTSIAYDSDDEHPAFNKDLLIVATVDALGNTVQAANDYRVLQPMETIDPNGNRAKLRFDALGLVVGTAVMGKVAGPVEGDSFDNFNVDLTQPELTDYFDSTNPRTLASGHLGSATTRFLYDLERIPACAALIARETHVSDLNGGESRLQLSFSYSDGFGREIQKKVQAEPGPVPQRNAENRIVLGADGQPQMTANSVDPRWVGSGWTLFNNKGKPVRQFEPFFSDTHKLDADVRIGVSSWLFYDPVGRVVATLHPNHTWEKQVFNPWQQTSHDVNDTLLIPVRASAPGLDADVAGYFGRLPESEYLPTWHELRTDPSHSADFAAQYPGQEDRTNESKAADKAATHAGTPSTIHFDALGRSFLTVARNRTVCEHHPLSGKPDEDVASRVELDIEGNPRVVRDPIEQAGDPLGRKVAQYDYDMLGSRIHQISMEAGARWLLNDVGGNPIRAWDSRGHRFTTTYDALRRPTGQYVRGSLSSPDPLKPNSDPRTLERDILVDRIEYGEGVADAEKLNLRTRVYRHFDSAGIATNAHLNAAGNAVVAYDFKGNLLGSTRQLLSDYKAVVDWSGSPALNSETFQGRNRYDALNRVIQLIAPHSSLDSVDRPGRFNVVQPVFNEADLLERVDVWLERAAVPVGLLDSRAEAASPVGVSAVDYDAKGQRLRIDYKNGASTFYHYDPRTFRITGLVTKRKMPPFAGDEQGDAQWPGRHVQNLHYTYDPTGNITHIRDDAQQRVFFDNRRVDPSNDYTYDALYRLVQATGREHLGQNGQALPHSHDDAFRVGRSHPNSGDLMARYCEKYVYDRVGNILSMSHHRSCDQIQGWTRVYDYLEGSLVESGDAVLLKTSNRLTRTRLTPGGNNPQPEAYQHDVHGNIVRMPHLGGGQPGPNMHWDYKDRLRSTDHGGGGTAHYVYDAAGQRVRKVWEKAPGLIEERIYLGGFEVFRRHEGPLDPGSLTFERETLHVMDDKQRVAMVEAETMDAAALQVGPREIRYQFGNYIGSAALELEDTGKVVSYEEFTPYGSSSFQAVRSLTDAPKRYRFTGKERDNESGFYCCGLRHYLPWLGRWAAPDRDGIASDMNLYCYVRSSPTNFHDPTGRADQQLWLAEQKKFTIDPVATRSSRGITERQHAALRGLDHGFGPNEGAHWGHPDDRPFVTQPAGTQVPLSFERAKDNLRKAHEAKAIGNAAAEAGQFKRVGGDDLTVPKGTAFKQPPPKPFEKDFAAYSKTIGKGQSAPATAAAAAPAPAPSPAATAAPAGGRSPQLTLPFNSGSATTAPKPSASPGSTGLGTRIVGSAGNAYKSTAGALKGAARTVRDNPRAAAAGVATTAGGVLVRSFVPGAAEVLESVAAVGVRGTAVFAGEALGEGALVVLSFAAGAAVGYGIDKGTEWASKKAFGVDLSPSSLIARNLTGADQAITQVFADKSKPAYTQSLGWKMADAFGL